ncbi:MAG: hypothetical protein VB861_04970 [Planctomycetaceae bacterium]
MTNESTSVVTATGSGDVPAEVTSADVVVCCRSWMVATGVGLGLSLLILVIGCLVSRRRLELVWGQS